jgi:hypothetical protein
MIEIKYCPTAEMIADYMTKPIVGSKFTLLKATILGLTPTVGQQECVGWRWKITRLVFYWKREIFGIYVYDTSRK